MNRDNIKRNVPSSGGLYELTSFGSKRPLYIGCSDNLQRRLLEHLAEKKPNRFRYQKAGFLQSPKSMEKKAFSQYENKYGEIPAWNVQDPRTSWI